MPVAVPLLEDALVDEHAKQLLREERVALGRAHDALQHGGVERAAAEQRLDHRLARLGVERVEHDPRRARARSPVGARLEELGPSRADDQDRRLVDRLQEVVDELEERRLRPVDVLDDEDDGPVGREVLEEPAHRPEQLLDRERLVRQPDRRRQPLA